MAPAAPILVVEDEAMIRMMVLEILEDEGYRVISARDADEAGHLLDAHPDITLLFTDVDMPGTIDGLALASRVHSTRPEIEIVVTSGRHQIADSALPDNGDFIPKPYTTQQLLDVVEKKLT